MAFPTTSVLDDFNRANSGSLGANWADVAGGSGVGTISSNQCALSTQGEMYWVPDTFGPDCEAYVTIPTLSPNSVDGHGVMARLTGVGTSAWSGYVVYVFLSASSGADTWEIYRVDSGVYTRLGAQISGPNLQAADGIGITCEDDTITAWHIRAGVAVEVGSRVDATYSDAGYVGMYMPAGSGAHDNFGGGTIALAYDPPTDTGWVTCGTGSSDDSYGDDAWDLPERIAVDNNLASVGRGPTSEYLKGTNFGFSIPDGSLILGIEVRFRLWTALSSLTSTVDRVRLVDATGAIGTEDRSDGFVFDSPPYTFSYTFREYGASDDLWDMTLTAADVNNANFGFVLALTNFNGSEFVEVNLFQMRVHYAPPLSNKISQTLPFLEQSAAATLTIMASSSQGLPFLEQSASGALSMSGALAQTLPFLEQASSGVISMTGTATQLLPFLEQTLAGELSLDATMTVVLPFLEQSASGNLLVSGTVDQILPFLEQAAAGDLSLDGEITVVLPFLEQAVTGVLSMNGVGTMVLPFLQQALTISGLMSGIAIQILPFMEQEANASFTMSGSISSVLPFLEQLASSDVLVTGTAAQVLPFIEQDLAAAGIKIEGSIENLLPFLEQSVTTTLVVTGSADLLLPFIDQTMMGADQGVSGAIETLLPFMHQNVVGDLSISGSIETLLPFMVQAAAGTIFDPNAIQVKLYSNPLVLPRVRPMLGNAAARFDTTFQIVNGPRFRGQLQEIADTTRVSNFHSARRLLRVRPGSAVRVRDVFRTSGGQLFLCASHGDRFRIDQLFREFKLFEMTEIAEWLRKEVTVDPVTGLEVGGDYVSKGPIYVAEEPAGDEEDQIRIPRQTFRLITGADLKVDDMVNGMIVRAVTTELGVTVAEIS